MNASDVKQIRLSFVLLLVLFLSGMALADNGIGSAVGIGYGDVGYESWPAFLRAQRVVLVSAEVEGLVVGIEHEAQDFVSEGDTLVRLDSSLVEMTVERIATQVEMSTDIAEAETGLEYSEDNLAIVQRLYDTEVGDARVGSPKELKEATQRRDMARFALQEAQMAMRLMELELRQNEELLARHTIVSPMDGVVVPFSSLNIANYDQIKQLVAGEMVSRGQAVMALMKVDHLRVSENLPLAQLDDVYLGQTANVYVQGGGDDPIVGSVVFISPTIGSTGEFTIEVEFENPVVVGDGEAGYRYRFRPGMSARIELRR